MEILESNNRYTDNLSFCGDVLFFLLMIQKKNLYFPSPAHMLIIHSWWTKMFFLKHFRLLKNLFEELAQCFIPCLFVVVLRKSGELKVKKICL